MYLRVKNWIQDRTGFTIYRSDSPWGFNLYNDIRRIAPDAQSEVIFDVGANIGQTAKAFRSAWSNSKIFCFEPVKGTYEILKREVQELSNVEAVHLALGSVSGEASIKLFSNSQLASLDQRFSAQPDDTFETVNISTVDEFCKHRSIPQIYLLKIDTEGHDLEVLKGSKELLEAGNINFILAEVTINTYPGKVLLSDINAFLENYGMTCIGIYEQKFWQQNGIYYYGNALFIRNNFIV